MGDSFSAGNGAGSYVGAAGRYRSNKNYAKLFAKMLTPAATVTNAACNGATTRDFFEPQVERGASVVPPQLNRVEGDEELILLTIGGNDGGFASIVRQCLISRQTAFTGNINYCPGHLDHTKKLVGSGLTRQS
jgi:lysophospholipase L1-like esterase